ncbi:MAG: hypothetical protein E7597_02425 [Ruminococcaceae bacterium]|nr:hypothetical protein [Oscillospiraceae bacterium]
MKKLSLCLAILILTGVFAFAVSPATSADTQITENGDRLYGIPERTTLAAFRGVYSRSGYSVFDKDNKTLPETGLIGTGCKLCYEAADVGSTVELTIVVTGDIDGNGKVTTTDYIAIKNQLVRNNLNDTEKLAADVDGYGISTTDYMKVKLHFEGLYDLYGGAFIPDVEDNSSAPESEEPDEPWTSGWA